MTNYVRLKFWHGGLFEKEPKLSYTGGEMTEFDIDQDMLCYWWLEDFAKKCRDYRKITETYYKAPGLSMEDGLRKVFADKEVLEMAKYTSRDGEIELYVVHEVDDELEFTKEMTEKVVSTTKRTHVRIEPRFKLTARKMVPPVISLSKPNPKDDDGAWVDNRRDDPLRFDDLLSDGGDSEISLYEPDECDTNLEFENEEGEHYFNSGIDVGLEFQIGDIIRDVVDIEAEIEKELVEKVIGSETDTSDDEYVNAINSVQIWNKGAVEIAFALQNEAAARKLVGQTETEVRSLSGRTTQPEVNNDFDSEYEDEEDEMLTPVESEDDNVVIRRNRARVPIVDEFTDYTKLMWKVGIKFPNRQKFKEAVTRYAVAQGRNLRIGVSNKNRQQRIGVLCQQGCPFRLYASWDSSSACFIVRSLNNTHKCNRNMERNTRLRSEWVARQFLEVFQKRPHWPAAEIVDTIMRAYKNIVKPGFAYRVKYHAHKKLHGSMKEHYNKLGRYVEALKMCNPTSVFLLLSDPSKTNFPPVFQRFFVCFDGVKKGWLQGCRRVLCIDGCFLKTFLGGQLLAAIGRDANDQMFPVAWAVVEGENNDSWRWFLEELKKCVGGEAGKEFTIVSDQHVAIKFAVSIVYPEAEHRNCARHIYAHWHKSFKGDEMKGLFWKAAKAYNEADFNDALTEMEEVNPAASVAFKTYKPESFCRAFVNTSTKCDVIVNNMAETFNGYIIKARVKHIIFMLEDIKTALMQRLVTKRQEAENGDSLICPRIQVKLEKEKLEAANCVVLPSSLMVFEVSHKMDKLTVDLNAKTCTCRKWDLCGFPCCHAISCIFWLRKEAEDFVDGCYKRSTNLRCYSGAIQPCQGERNWPKVDVQMDPPPIKIGPGRPRRNRRKDPHEDPKKPGKLSRHGREMTCSVCKSKTHTKRKCPEKDNIIESAPKNKRGRPRKWPAPERRVVEMTNDIHNSTAEPSRTGRNGRTIRAGRGGRGINGGRGRNGRRGGITPTGYGVYINEDGNTFINRPGQQGGPLNVATSLMPATSNYQMSTQPSTSNESYCFSSL